MAPYYPYTDSVWSNWSLTASTTSNVSVWSNWIGCNDNVTTGTASASLYGHTHSISGNSGYAETDEQREAREERERQYQERWAAELELKKAAKLRAAELLREALTPEQEEEYVVTGHFHVHTADGVRAYRLKPGHQPVRVKSDDGYQYSYCIHPRESFPAEDTTLALKLLLEADEARFLAIANATRRAAVAA